MAVAVQLEFPGATLGQYDQVIKKMGFTPGGPRFCRLLFGPRNVPDVVASRSGKEALPSLKSRAGGGPDIPTAGYSKGLQSGMGRIRMQFKGESS